MKSVLDFVAALVALLLLSPLFLVVAIAIKCDSRGPVFFTQERIGRNGKHFRCVKFRSMRLEARHDVAGYEYGNVDEYITKTGAFLRKHSIDELPQLFNVLAFQMSLIGFRPAQPSETVLNDERERLQVYQVMPGITGWAQVNGRDLIAAHPAKKAELDAYYVRKFSLWLDIKIFFMTIAQVFKGEDVVEGVVDETEEEKKEAALPEAENPSSSHALEGLEKQEWSEGDAV